jgi:hypothetical protein
MERALLLSVDVQDETTVPAARRRRCRARGWRWWWHQFLGRSFAEASLIWYRREIQTLGSVLAPVSCIGHAGHARNLQHQCVGYSGAGPNLNKWEDAKILARELWGGGKQIVPTPRPSI